MAYPRNPDENNDWLNQGEKNSQVLFLLETKRDISDLFPGIKTNRDAWVYNFQKISNYLRKLTIIIEFIEQILRLIDIDLVQKSNGRWS